MSTPSQIPPVPLSAGQSDQAHSAASPKPLPIASVARATPTATEPANTAASSDLSDTGQTQGGWPLGPYHPKKTKRRSKHFPKRSRYTLETEDDESDEDPQSNDDVGGTKAKTIRSTASEDSHRSTQNVLAATPARSTQKWRDRSPAHRSQGYVPGTYTHTIDLSTVATLIYQGKVYIRVGWAEGHRTNKEYWAYARVGDDGAIQQVFGCGIVFDDRPMFYESKFARKDVEAWRMEVGEAVARVEARQTDRTMPREDAYARLTSTRTNTGLTVTWQPDLSAIEAPSTVTYQSTTFASPTEPDEPVPVARAPTETYQSTTFAQPAESNEPVPSPPALTTELSNSSNTTGRVYDTAQLLALAQSSGSPNIVLSDDLQVKFSTLDIAQHLTIHANPNAIIRALLKHCHGNSIPADDRIRSLFGFQALASVEEETKLLRMYQDAIRIGLSKGRLEGWLHRYMLFGKIIELFDRQNRTCESQRWLSANIAVLQGATQQSVFDWVDAAKEYRNKDNLQAPADKEPAFDYEAMAAERAAAAEGVEDEVSAEGDDFDVEAETQGKKSAHGSTKDTEGWDDAELGPWTQGVSQTLMAEDLAGAGEVVGAAGEVMGDLIDFGEEETVIVSEAATSSLHRQDVKAEDEGTKPESLKAGKGGDGGEEFWGLL